MYFYPTEAIHERALLYYVPLCVGGSKGKAGIHLKYYPERRDAFEMYPGKSMHMLHINGARVY